MLPILPKIESLQEGLKLAIQRYKRVEQLLSIAHFGYWEFNLSDHKLFWSDEMYTIWCKTAGSFDPTIEFFLQSIHPADIDNFENEFISLCSGTKELNIDFRILLPDGNEKWINSKGSFSKDENGKVTCVQGIVYDITANKIAEYKMIESEKKYRAIIEYAQHGILQVDKKNIVTTVNKYFSNLLGFTPEEMTGKDANIFIDETAGKKIFSRLSDWEKGLSTLQEITFVNAINLTFYSLVQSTPLFKNGVYDGSLSLILDITEKKRAQTLLQINDEAFYSSSLAIKLLFDNSPFASLIFEPDGHIFVANEGALKLFDYTSDELYELNYINLFETGMNNFNELVEIINQSKPLKGKINGIKRNKDKFQATFTIKILEENGLTLFCVILSDLMGLENPFLDINLVMNNTKEPFLMIDKQHTLVGFNKIAQKFYIDNLAIRLEKGKSIIDYVKPERREMLREVYKKVFDGIPQESKIKIHTIQGQNKIYKINYNPIKNDYEEVIGSFITSTDITNETLLLEGYRKAQKIGRMGNWELDLNNKKLSWSDEIYNLFGLPLHSANLDFDTFMALVHPDDREFVVAEFNAAIQEVKPYNIIHRILVNNEVKYIHAAGELIKDENGKAIHFAGTVQDITERHTAEKKNLLKAAILRTIGEAVVATDPDSKIIYWNKTAENIFEWNADEVLGKNIIELIFPLQSKLRAKKILENILKNKSWSGEILVKRKQGYEFPAFIINTPMFSNNDKVSGIICIFTDISQRKKDIESLIISNTELQRLSGYLQNIREEERKHIAREIHDELGQRLTSIKMDLSWINKKITVNVAECKNRTDEMMVLVDGTIKLVRKIAYELRPAILDDLGLAEAIKWYINDFSKHSGVHVDFKNNVETMIFTQDITTAVFRIFQESLTNVARHSKANIVCCDLVQREGHLHLAIKDNGVGFDLSEKTSSLGLLGMKERVNLLNGKYVVNSEKNKGTVITVTIPIPSSKHSDDKNIDSG